MGSCSFETFALWAPWVDQEDVALPLNWPGELLLVSRDVLLLQILKTNRGLQSKSLNETTVAIRGLGNTRTQGVPEGTVMEGRVSLGGLRPRGMQAHLCPRVEVAKMAGSE